MITDTLRKNLTVKGHDELQNQGKLGSASIQKSANWPNVFSLSKWEMTRIILFLGIGFCIPQKVNHWTVFTVFSLHNKNSSRSSFTKEGGFWKWKKSEKIYELEASQSLRDFFTAWWETKIRNTLGVSIDNCIEKQTRDEKKRWKVLTRTTEVIPFLAKQDHALREHFESLHVDSNHGNFLELMKLIARYDPISRITLKWAEIIRTLFTTFLIKLKINWFS